MSSSRRIVSTSSPIIVEMGRLLRSTPGPVLSLSQGMVHWAPPDTALNEVRLGLLDPNTARYGADEGLEQLRAALKGKIAKTREAQRWIVENGQKENQRELAKVQDVVQATSKQGGDVESLSKQGVEGEPNRSTTIQGTTKQGMNAFEVKTGQAEKPAEAAVMPRGKAAAKLPNEQDFEVMVTSGSNQAFMNILLACTDAGDAVGVLTPYYFNHEMAATMTSCRVVKIPRKDSMHLDPGVVEQAIIRNKLKLVVVANPCNPTGVVVEHAIIQKIADVCKKHRTTLVMDNTYEDFLYGDAVKAKYKHVFGSNVFNLFSFSKNYGMAGYRCGYFSYPSFRYDDLIKAQDTIAICPPILSQRAALGALAAGDEWIQSRVDGLQENIQVVRSALVKSGIETISGGEGGIFLFAKLWPSANPKKPFTDWTVTERLVREFGVSVIPGKGVGMPGWIRLCYANLPIKTCIVAAERLELGLNTIRKDLTK